MSDKKTGGTAFPVARDEYFPHDSQAGKPKEGMTLRDYFAGKELSKKDSVSVCDQPSAYGRLADHCYRMADAMLEARTK